MVDVTTRSVADLRRELNFITGTPEITIPAFVTFVDTSFGHALFLSMPEKSFASSGYKTPRHGWDDIFRNQSAPSAKSLVYRRSAESKGFQGQVLKHAVGFSRLYRSKLTKMQMILALGNGLLVCPAVHYVVRDRGWIRKRPQPRAYISTTEPLDHMYTPAFALTHA